VVRRIANSPIQAPHDALQALITKSLRRAQQMRAVTDRGGDERGEHVNNREMPDICLQHVLAVMLLDKTVSFAAAHAKTHMQDSEV
jgi:hypothetical protein